MLCRFANKFILLPVLRKSVRADYLESATALYFEHVFKTDDYGCLKRHAI